MAEGTFSQACVNHSVHRGGGAVWVSGQRGGLPIFQVGGLRFSLKWETSQYGNTVNARSIRILLECILVISETCYSEEQHKFKHAVKFQLLHRPKIMK